MDFVPALIVLAVGGGFVLLRSVTRRIRSPRLGFLNLKGPGAADLVRADHEALASLFSTSEESTDAPPRCDVLFLYCDIDRDGKIAGRQDGLLALIRRAGARVVVVASENDGSHAMASTRKARAGRANLVFTLDRKGPLFAAFFARLFGEMTNGVSMPRAWVKLAPQIRGRAHADCPDTVFLCEAGHIAFAAKPGSELSRHGIWTTYDSSPGKRSPSMPLGRRTPDAYERRLAGQ